MRGSRQLISANELARRRSLADAYQVARAQGRLTKQRIAASPPWAHGCVSYHGPPGHGGGQPDHRGAEPEQAFAPSQEGPHSR